jgi:hypothetical protein
MPYQEKHDSGKNRRAIERFVDFVHFFCPDLPHQSTEQTIDYILQHGVETYVQQIQAQSESAKKIFECVRILAQLQIEQAGHV